MKPLFVPAREGDDKRGDGEGHRADRQDRAGDAGNEEAGGEQQDRDDPEGLDDFTVHDAYPRRSVF